MSNNLTLPYPDVNFWWTTKSMAKVNEWNRLLFILFTVFFVSLFTFFFVRSMLKMKFSSLLIYFPSSLNPLWSFQYGFPFFYVSFFRVFSSFKIRSVIWAKKDIMHEFFPVSM